MGQYGRTNLALAGLLVFLTFYIHLRIAVNCLLHPGKLRQLETTTTISTTDICRGSEDMGRQTRKWSSSKMPISLHNVVVRLP